MAQFIGNYLLSQFKFFTVLKIFWQAVGIRCTPKTQVVGRGVRGVLTPGSTPVPVTVALVTHETPAFLDFVFACFGTCGVLVQLESIVSDGPPVRGPLPNVSHHVV